MSGTGRLAQILERFSRAMNMKISVDKQVSALNFSVPGFKYDDFDRAGFLNLAKVNRMMEMTRMNDIKLISPELPSRNIRSFLLGSHLKASKLLYSHAAVDYPMKFQMQLCNVGKSSIDAVQRLIDERSDSVLAQRIVRVVNIDPITRTSTPIPEDYRRLMKEKVHTSDDLRLPRLDLPTEIPEKHFLHQDSVRFSDLDFVFHSNQGSYLTYSFECAAQAAAKKFYSNIHDDICFYPAKSALGLHVSECFAGDALQVLTWEDENDPMVIYFVVKNKDAIAYYAKVEFYRPEELTNL